MNVNIFRFIFSGAMICERRLITCVFRFFLTCSNKNDSNGGSVFGLCYFRFFAAVEFSKESLVRNKDFGIKPEQRESQK